MGSICPESYIRSLQNIMQEYYKQPITIDLHYSKAHTQGDGSSCGVFTIESIKKMKN
jgi:hypothetical protein